MVHLKQLDLDETGRSFDFSKAFKGCERHPEGVHDSAPGGILIK